MFGAALAGQLTRPSLRDYFNRGKTETNHTQIIILRCEMYSSLHGNLHLHGTVSRHTSIFCHASPYSMSPTSVKMPTCMSSSFSKSYIASDNTLTPVDISWLTDHVWIAHNTCTLSIPLTSTLRKQVMHRNDIDLVKVKLLETSRLDRRGSAASGCGQHPMILEISDPICILVHGSLHC
jgi:hypothetical protein